MGSTYWIKLSLIISNHNNFFNLQSQIVEQFQLDAETNKANYQPNQELASNTEVNESFLESLKKSYNEPFELSCDIPDSSKNIQKSAVDAAFSLSSAFQPEDDDVDLDTLVNGTIDDAISQNTILRETKLKEKSCSLTPTNSDSLEEPTPLLNSNEKSPSPTINQQIIKEKSPSPAIIQQIKKEKSPSPIVISSFKEKSPSPLEIQKSIKQNSASSVLEDTKPIEVPPLITSVASKNLSQNPMNLNFGLPKPQQSDSLNPSSTKSINFDIPPLEVSSGAKGQRKSRRNRAPASEVLDDPTKPPPEVKEEVVEDDKSLFVDLDAPVEPQKKPVLLISKDETENLEDWLDSVLDD